MYEEIFIAGSGGQGVLTVGKIIAQAAMDENKFVTYYPSYGAEIRGGTANCMIKISDNFIYSPVVETPTITVIMNMPSYIKFVNKLSPTKYLILNSSLIKDTKEITQLAIDQKANFKIIKIPATELANKLGSTVAANIIILGALIKVTRVIENINTVKNVITRTIREKFWELNLNALNMGFNFI